MTLVQDVQQLLVRVLPTWVQVLPDGAAEQEGVLGNDGQPGPEEGVTPTHNNVAVFCHTVDRQRLAEKTASFRSEPELGQAHRADVQPVQENLTPVQLHHAEQGQEQGGLA